MPPKVVRFEDPYAAAAENLASPIPSNQQEEQNEEYKPLSVIGEIKEKGFSTAAAVKPRLPQITVLPFPVARHRSHGPHWDPIAPAKEEPMELDENEEQVVEGRATAQPLQKKKTSGLDFRKWKVPAASKVEEVEEVAVLPTYQVNPVSRPQQSQKKIKPVTEKDEIDAENRATIMSMSPAEILSAQQDVLRSLGSDKVNLFKKRGQEKEQKRLVEMQKDQEASNEPMDTTSEEVEEKHSETSTPIAEERIAGKNEQKITQWEERVEAVKLMKFDLDGKVLGTGLHSEPTTFFSVAERDFLRSEGDPAALGYTIKEATTLLRSTVPGQRVAGLHLLAAILSNAANRLHTPEPDDTTDWQAVWAYSLGPHPELVLTLRLALDDTHVSSLIACAKALQAMLSCLQNENFFSICENLWPGEPLMYTAPVFRKHVSQEDGCLGRGHWKYNVKSSDLLPKMTNDADKEGEDTVADDATIATKDVAAGLLKMGILPRIRYILEVEKLIQAEEALLSVLIAFARHSPAAADAVMECPRLIYTVVQSFIVPDESSDVHLPARAKAIQLIKVLSQTSKSYCVKFAELGALQTANSELFKWSYAFTANSKGGHDMLRLYRTLLEALRLWKTCIHHDIGLNLFPDFYPALCTWLAPPSAETSGETFDLARESYNVLEVLARKLPTLRQNKEPEAGWSWAVATPVIQNCLNWLRPQNISVFTGRREGEKPGESLFLGILGSILHFLATACERLWDEETAGNADIFLPEFVPEIGLALVRSSVFVSGNATLVSIFMRSSNKADTEVLLPLANCIRAAIRLACVVDRLLSWAKASSKVTVPPGSSEEECILHSGLMLSAEGQLKTFADFAEQEIKRKNHIVQDYNGRGGPAPGLGFGWGASRGGFWSAELLLLRTYASILLDLDTLILDASMETKLRMVTVWLDPSLIHRAISKHILAEDKWLLLLRKAVDSVAFWKQGDQKPPVLTVENISKFEGGREFLIEHYSQLWLQKKLKKEKTSDLPLATIHEDDESPASNLLREWNGTRLPLPMHWVLSPLHQKKSDDAESAETILAGLLFILGCSGEEKAISISRKVHALSAVFSSGEVFLEPPINELLGVLQSVYAKQLDDVGDSQKLDFLGEVDATTYPLFLENLAHHFAAASYADINFGRQLAFYLRPGVAPSLRQIVWRTLAETKTLNLLPRLEECAGQPTAYLDPPETNAESLEMYVSTWTSGGLDRAFVRKCLPFRLALHHIAHFIFRSRSDENLLLRNKFCRNILRTSKRSRESKEMFMELLNYFPAEADRNRRLLEEACDGDQALLAALQNLNLGTARTREPVGALGIPNALGGDIWME